MYRLILQSHPHTYQYLFRKRERESGVGLGGGGGWLGEGCLEKNLNAIGNNEI